MTKIEQAISATRGEMRHLGIDPLTRTAKDAEAMLDDMAREGHHAGLWFWSASENQVKEFRKEWAKWISINRK